MATDNFGRQTNDKKLKMHIYEEDATMIHSPSDEIEGGYWGQYSKLFTLHNMIFAEQRARLTN